jgi:hypothetical protein
MSTEFTLLVLLILVAGAVFAAHCDDDDFGGRA